MVYPFRFTPDPSGLTAVTRQNFCGGAWLIVDAQGGIWTQCYDALAVGRAKKQVRCRWAEISKQEDVA